VAYQSYRKSIHDIENVRFRDGEGSAAGVKKQTSDVVVASGDAGSRSNTLRARDFVAYQPKADRSRDQVIDLT